MNDLAGWSKGTWGYHSDDGTILSGEVELDRNEAYGPGDVIGVAFDLDSRKLWFTKNNTLSVVSWQSIIDQAAIDEKKAAEEGTDEDGGAKDDNKDEKEDEEEEDEEKEDEEEEDEEKEDEDEDTKKDDGEDFGIYAPLLKGQLYPCVSFQHAYRDGIKVRVNFGPDGAAHTPFKYPAPTAVPEDPPAKLERPREGDDSDDDNNDNNDKAANEEEGRKKEDDSDANDKDSDSEST